MGLLETMSEPSKIEKGQPSSSPCPPLREKLCLASAGTLLC